MYIYLRFVASLDVELWRLSGLIVGLDITCVTTVSDLTNCSFSVDQQQGEMAALESGGGFNQKRNTNSQVG